MGGNNTAGMLPSQRVVVAAPLSFAGSAGRIWPMARGHSSGWVTAAAVTGALLLILLAWAFVLCWYAIWGIWLIPYRIVRRGQRKRKLEARRHAEMLAAARRTG
jgi:uncharacterized membrane-anchored protein